jgi:hypothetical protein
VLVLALLSVFASGVRADGDDALPALGGASRIQPLFVLTEARLRMTYFNQQGRGYQSQADVSPGVPGSERLDVYQPVFSFGIDQGDDVHHTVVLPVDIVTSASADALDVISRASLVNEAVTADITTDWQATDDDDLSFRYGAHIEEPFRSGFVGVGYTRWLAQDNATISANLQAHLRLVRPDHPAGLGPRRHHPSDADLQRERHAGALAHHPGWRELWPHVPDGYARADVERGARGLLATPRCARPRRPSSSPTRACGTP